MVSCALVTVLPSGLVRFCSVSEPLRCPQCRIRTGCGHFFRDGRTTFARILLGFGAVWYQDGQSPILEVQMALQFAVQLTEVRSSYREKRQIGSALNWGTAVTTRPIV